MDIVIKEMVNGDQNKFANLDDSFVIDSALELFVQNQKVSYTVKGLPSYTKSYQDDPTEEMSDKDYLAYIDDPNKIIFLAFVESGLAGKVMVKRNWNEFAYIEDLQVDSRYRRHGVGRMLVEKVKQWALDRSLSGIMLETQNTNVRACKFYESLGFVIGGFDFCLYKAVQQVEETAIYWYLLFD
ncbi:GNAT family N-acetyltransferase [Shimazuella sp. AN120528]|uniref:GNAT family N-acetyltransferase n=1 Tax=Shimazuella soli TaxID=1892854 RepID=UPI001F0DB421|nr:GNAT family N-acetyltransferase [Shimazuella soli]MCH5584057.1 GNAT family N-acetyltransferase [Shimazuella soli]